LLQLHDKPKTLRQREGIAIGHLGRNANFGDSTDHGCHLVGAQFSVFGSGPNVIPQNMKLNQSGQLTYGQMGTTWRYLLKRGARVFVDIRLQESSTNPNRPEGILVRFTVDLTHAEPMEPELMEPELMELAKGQSESFFPNAAPYSWVSGVTFGGISYKPTVLCGVPGPPGSRPRHVKDGSAVQAGPTLVPVRGVVVVRREHRNGPLERIERRVGDVDLHAVVVLARTTASGQVLQVKTAVR